MLLTERLIRIAFAYLRVQRSQVSVYRLAIQIYIVFAFGLRWKMKPLRMRSILSGIIQLYKSIWMASLQSMNWSMKSLSHLSKWVKFKPNYLVLHLRCFQVALPKIMLALVAVVHHPICLGERRRKMVTWLHLDENGDIWSQTNKKTNLLQENYRF